MKCPTCGTDNKSTNKACYRCGILLADDGLTPRGTANSLWYSKDRQKNRPPLPPFWGKDAKPQDYDQSKEFMVLGDEEKDVHYDADLRDQGAPLPSNRKKLSTIKSGKEIEAVLPPTPRTRARIQTRRYSVNWKRFALAIAVIALLSGALTYGLSTGYKWAVGAASQWLADRNGTAPATEPLVEKILINGETWHRITFYGKDGEQVLVTNPRRPLSIQSGTAQLLLDDQSFIPTDLSLDKDKVTVELEATMFSVNGEERKVIIPPYEIKVPLSPLKIILPADQTTPIDENLVQVKVKVTPGSRVIIGKKNVTDSVDKQGYVSSYVQLSPIGINEIPVTVETKKYRRNNYTLQINRPKMDVPISLDSSVKTTTEDNTVLISGTTKPGATITTDAKLAGNGKIEQDMAAGTFSFTVSLKRWGINRITITATAANGRTSSMVHCVNRNPSLENYTKGAWPIEYDYLTTAAESRIGTVYVLEGTVVSKLQNESGDYYLFNVGTDAAPKFLVLEYGKEAGLKEGQAYKIFADVIGVVENYPALAARFVYPKETAN